MMGENFTDKNVHVYSSSQSFVCFTQRLLLFLKITQLIKHVLGLKSKQTLLHYQIDKCRRG